MPVSVRPLPPFPTAARLPPLPIRALITAYCCLFPGLCELVAAGTSMSAMLFMCFLLRSVNVCSISLNFISLICKMSDVCLVFVLSVCFC